MKKSVFYTSLLAGILTSSLAFAVDSEEELCKKLDDLAHNKVETTAHVKAFEQLGKPLMAEKDCQFIKENYQKPGWALIDVRDKVTKQSTEVFPGTVQIVSDHSDPAGHQWTEKDIPAKLANHAQKQGRKVASLEDAKETNMIIFCNGLKCYRTAHAACTLKQLGFSKEKVFMVLDGYDGLKQHCLK